MKSIVICLIFCFLSVVAGERLRRQINNFQGFPAFPFPQPTFNFQPGQPGTQSSFTSQSLNTRFGEDSQPVVTGQSTHFTSTGNNFQQTNTFLRPDGSLQTNKQSGRVRRQTPTKHEEKPIKNNDRPDNIELKQQPAPQPPVIPQQNYQQQPNHQQQQPNYQQQQANHQQQQPNYQQQQPNYQQQQPNYQQQQPNYQQQQPNYQQQQPNYQQQQPNYQQQPYPQQAIPANQFPFGIGFFGQPQFGFQGPFGFAPVGFPQPVPQGIPSQGNFIGASQTLDNRFGEEEGVVTSGGSQLITSQNGNYHITSSVLKPDGHVVTSQQSGTVNKKP